MIFRNRKTIQNILLYFTIRAWLFLLSYQFINDPRTCSAFPNFNESVTELEKSSLVDSTNSEQVQQMGSDRENATIISEQNPEGERDVCRFFKSTRRLMCSGSIDYKYLQEIKNEEISDFIVENYEAVSFYKKKHWSAKNLETGEWYTKLPKLYQKLTGEVQLKDTGLQITINARVLPRKDSKSFSVEGEAFSNKVIKISWKLKGEISLDFVKEKTVISLDVGAVGDSYWRLQSNFTFFTRNALNETDGWKTVGIIKSNSVSENQFVVYRGTLWTKMIKDECKFSGNVKLQSINLDASFFGTVLPPQKKQITIPKSAFSNMTIKNMIFKDSNFYNDFDKNSFEGLLGLKRISFVGSKLEILPRLDELFQGFCDLEEIYFEDCTTPRLKFGALSPLLNVRKLSFKGSGPLNFDDTSFLWLRNSNLTFLSLRNSHVKISATANSILWSVNNTLTNLELSYSTLNGEKDLTQVLKNLKILRLEAEGLRLQKIPTNALKSVQKSLMYLSLRENDFRKDFEKHLFDSIMNFPIMLNLMELNLEDCHINYIERGTFDNLPNLKILHLSYNNLENIQDGWTHISPGVKYLSLSFNGLTPQTSSMSLYDAGSSMNLRKFKDLEILDLSNGIFTSVSKLINGLGSNLRNLTLRNTRLEDLPNNFFENLTGLENLDLSSNRDLKSSQPFSFNLFKNLKSLKFLDLKNCRITGSVVEESAVENQEDFKLENLQSLDLSLNNFKILDPKILRAFPKLKILNLSGNSIGSWSVTMSFNEHLEALFLDENKIETITNEMLSGIKTVKHIKLGNNPFVCGSYVYEFLKIINETLKDSQTDQFKTDRRHFFNDPELRESDFIKNLFLKTRRKHEIGNTKIVDWSEKNYICFSWSQGKFVPFTEVKENFSDSSRHNTERVQVTLVWLTFVIVLGIVITVAIICWKFLDIHLITRAVRNAVALSFISRSEKIPTNFKYNVFVSYTDQDRTWVVENLLPRLESKSEMKVCLHERDFQVGLSIIENILNSIESSRNIILVVSQAFLKSQWCQYEMQLAEFRLLEKGRDQLILIFLENIPMAKRPKALRYLMMTKTYIEWPSHPKSPKEISNFWDRLMKSMVNMN